MYKATLRAPGIVRSPAGEKSSASRRPAEPRRARNPLWHHLATGSAAITQTASIPRIQREVQPSGESEAAPEACPDRASQPVAPALLAAGQAGSSRTFGNRLTAAEERAWSSLPESCRQDSEACETPAAERLSRLYGRIHAAMDVNAPVGTAVYAPIRGTVIPAGTASGYGNRVLILHACPPVTSVAGTRPVTTFYAHLESVSVTVGQQVTAGQQIGTVGATGRGSGRVRAGMGAHLHFSVQAVPRGGPTRNMGSRYEERRDIRIRPDVWLRELGVAVSVPVVAP